MLCRLSSAGKAKIFPACTIHRSPSTCSIEIFSDEGNVIVDTCARSGATLIAARDLNRDAEGFEISAEFYSKAVGFMFA